MLGYCKKGGYVCLITEFVKGGALSNSLFDGSQMDPVAIAIGIAKGIPFFDTSQFVRNGVSSQ
jgi:predicted ATP-grasp superfamily ATP-dependent carboligase